MDLHDIQLGFNRALAHTFDKKKFLLVFLYLVCCGLFVVFFRGLSINASQWLLLSLSFLPIFICAGVLLSLGIFLIRVYHDEIKQKEISYTEIFGKSWEVMIGASYFFVPVILSYLLLWMILGVFLLLQQIPAFGEFFSAILAFAPFLLNLGTLVLCVLSLSVLFYLTPVIALKGYHRLVVSETFVTRFKEDAFSNLFLGSISLIPFLVIFGLSLLAAYLSGTVCYHCENPLTHTVQWFFMMIPFVAALTPAVIFFFNFSAESHVMLMKALKNKKNA